MSHWMYFRGWLFKAGLKFNPMIQFLCFYISVYFKTLQTKTTIDPDKTRNISQYYPQATGKFGNFTLTQG